MASLMEKKLTDEDLVPRLAAGDEDAIQLFLDRYWASAYRVALRLQGDPGAAEDVTQEAVIETLRSASRFEAGRSFRPWFFTILRPVASNHRRAETRRKKREQAAARPERAAASLRENLEAVQVYLTRLKPELREVLTLHFLEGLSHREVAAATGCPAGTVTYRIQAGLKKLRASLRASPAMAVLPFFDQLTAAIDENAAPAAPSAAQLAAELLRVPPAPVPPKAATLAKSVKPAGTLVKALAGLGLLLGSLAPIALLTESEPPTPDRAAAEARRPRGEPAGERKAKRSTTQPPAAKAPEAPAAKATTIVRARPFQGRLTLGERSLAGARVRLLVGAAVKETLSDAEGRFALSLAAAPSALEVEVRCPRPWGVEKWSTVLLQSKTGEHSARLPWPKDAEELAVDLAPRRIQGRVLPLDGDKTVVDGRLWLPGGAVAITGDGAFDHTVPRLDGYEALWVTAKGAAIAGTSLKRKDFAQDMMSVFQGMGGGELADNPLISMMQSLMGNLGEEYEKEDGGRILFRLAIPLRRGGELRGRVVDERGLPIPAARLNLHAAIPSAIADSEFALSERAVLSAESDENGRFAFSAVPEVQGLLGSLGLGRSLRVTAEGCVPLRRSELRFGELGDVRLEALSELNGRVVNEAGRGLAAALYRIAEAGPRFTIERSGEAPKVIDRYRRAAPVNTDAEGRFRLAMPAGPSRWLVVAPGYADRVLELEAPGSGEAITLSPSAWIRGRARPPTSVLLAVSTELRLFPAGALAEVPDRPSTLEALSLPPALALTILDEQGRFAFEGLASGHYDLIAIAGGVGAENGVVSFARVALRRGVSTGSELVLKREDFVGTEGTTTYEIRVFDENGRPIREDVTLVACTESGEYDTLTALFDADEQRWFGSALLPPKSRVRLAALAPGRPPRFTDWLDPEARTEDELPAVDAGELVLPRGGGQLRLQAPAPQASLGSWSLKIRDPKTGLIIEETASSSGVVLTLWPGKSTLAAEFESETNKLLAPVPFEVVAGQTTELRLALPNEEKK